MEMVAVKPNHQKNVGNFTLLQTAVASCNYLDSVYLVSSYDIAYRLVMFRHKKTLRVRKRSADASVFS